MMCVGLKEPLPYGREILAGYRFSMGLMNSLKICFYHVMFNGDSLIDVIRANNPVTALRKYLPTTENILQKMRKFTRNLHAIGNSNRARIIPSELLQYRHKSVRHHCPELDCKNIINVVQCLPLCFLQQSVITVSNAGTTDPESNSSKRSSTVTETETVIKAILCNDEIKMERYNVVEGKPDITNNTKTNFISTDERLSTGEDCQINETEDCQINETSDNCQNDRSSGKEIVVLSAKIKTPINEFNSKLASFNALQTFAGILLQMEDSNQNKVELCTEDNIRTSKLLTISTWKDHKTGSYFKETSLRSERSFPRLLHKDTVTSVSKFMEINKPARDGSKSLRTYSLKEAKSYCMMDDSRYDYSLKDQRHSTSHREQTNLASAAEVISLTPSKRCDEQPMDSTDVLENLHERTLFTMTQPEVLDIQSSVEFLVRRLLYKVGDLNSNFRVRDIVVNGSFYDGSKIITPDEFDYLAVIDKLSVKGTTISRECEQNHGFAHVKLDKSMGTIWDGLSSKRQLYSIKQNGDRASFRDQFRMLFHDIVRKTIGNDSSVQIHKLSGSLMLYGYNVSLHGPECVVLAHWYSRTSMTSFPITIDICPAIQADCVSDIVTTDDPLFLTAYHSMLQEQRYFLIPSDSKTCSYCFKLAFTDSDQWLVSNLTEKHRKCFRVLKFLFTEAGKVNCGVKKIMNSFAIKMAILWHADRCSTPSSIKDCTTHTLEYLRDSLSLKVPFLPNVHIKSRNVWKNLATSVDDDKNCSTVVKLIDTIIELFGDRSNLNDLKLDFIVTYIVTETF